MEPKAGKHSRAWHLLLPLMLLAACATATGEPPMAPDDAYGLQGDGPFKRFIVRYSAGSAPGRDPSLVPARLEHTAERAALASKPGLAWQRRLAVNGDVFIADRPLDRAEAEALMRAFNADPAVESIQVDAMMGVDPVRTMPLRED